MSKLNPDKLIKVVIEVTASLVKSGTVNDSTDCPVASALRKVVNKAVEIDAGYEHLTFELPDIFAIPTPAKVAKFMAKIDARDPNDIPEKYDEATDEFVPGKLPPAPKPFSFVIRLPNRFLRKGLQA